MQPFLVAFLVLCAYGFQNASFYMKVRFSDASFRIWRKIGFADYKCHQLRAESLTAILKEQSNAVVIGQCTAGDCGSRGCNFKTSHGIEFKLATQPPYLLPDGETWSEGQGVAPDIEVEKCLPWERKKKASGAAIELIRQDKLKNSAYELK